MIPPFIYWANVVFFDDPNNLPTLTVSSALPPSFPARSVLGLQGQNESVRLFRSRQLLDVAFLRRTRGALTALFW